MRYVGFCYDTKAWGGDLTGLLLVEKEGAWLQAGSHISSGVGWSQIDIRGHYDRRLEQLPDDTFEWAGLLDVDEAMQRFPAARDAELEPATE